MNRKFFFIFIFASVLAISLAGDCSDNPLIGWSSTCNTGVPNVSNNSDNPAESTFTIDASAYLETAVVEDFSGMCLTLTGLKESCCSEQTYLTIKSEFTEMKTFMYQTFTDIELITNRAIFSLKFMYWLLEELINFAADMTAGFSGVLGTIRDKVISALGVVRVLFKYVTGITAAALDIDHYVVNPKYCTSMPRTCSDVTQCRNVEYAACVEDNSADYVECVAIEKKCTQLEADCEAKGTLDAPDGCGDLYKCYKGALVLSSGVMCLSCTPEWEKYISCDDNQNCTIQADATSATRMNAFCEGFALEFIPNAVKRVLAYVFNDILECDPGSEKITVTADEITECKNNKSEATCSAGLGSVISAVDSNTTADQCYDLMVSACEQNDRGVNRCKEHMETYQTEIKTYFCPAVISGTISSATDACSCYKSSDDPEGLCIPYWPANSYRDTMFDLVAKFMNLLTLYSTAIDGLNATGIISGELANILFPNVNGMDVGFVLNNNPDVSNWGMAAPMGFVLEVSDWIWNTFWGWLPDADDSSFFDTLLTSVVGYLVGKYASETGSTIPSGIPGSTSSVITNVYEAYLTDSDDPRLTNRLWSASRGGLAETVNMKGMFRILERNGAISREEYHRPGFSIIDFSNASEANRKEVIKAANELSTAASLVATQSMSEREGGCEVTYESGASFSIDFTSNGDAQLYKWGCETGFAGDGCSLLTTNVDNAVVEKIYNTLDDLGLSAVREWLESIQEKYGNAAVIAIVAAPFVILLIIIVCCACACMRGPKMPATLGAPPGMMAPGGFGGPPSMGAYGAPMGGSFGGPPSMGGTYRGASMGGTYRGPSMGAPMRGGAPGSVRGGRPGMMRGRY